MTIRTGTQLFKTQLDFQEKFQNRQPPRAETRGRESTLEAEGHECSVACEQGGHGDTRGRESTSGRGTRVQRGRASRVGPRRHPEAESLRSKPRDTSAAWRASRVGPRRHPRPRVYARSRGTRVQRGVRAGWAHVDTPRPRVYARGRGTRVQRGVRAGWAHVDTRGRESTLEAEGHECSVACEQDGPA